MTATDLLLWGMVVHLVIDWLGQNEWMAVNKAKRREHRRRLRGRVDQTYTRWWDRHPAAYVHAGMHGAAQLLVFPWWAALAIGVTHLLIDTRVPVAWWSKLIGQTQPVDGIVDVRPRWDRPQLASGRAYFDIGADVRIWADQVWHIAVIALLALAAT